MYYVILFLLFLLYSCKTEEEVITKSEPVVVMDSQPVLTPPKEEKQYPVRALKKKIVPRFREHTMIAVLDSLNHGDTLFIIDSMFEPENGNILLVSHIKDTTSKGWIYAYDSTQLQNIATEPVQPLQCIYVSNISIPLYIDDSLESYYYRFYTGDTVLIHDSMKTKEGWVYYVTNTREEAKGWYKPVGESKSLVSNATPAIMLHSFYVKDAGYQFPVFIPTLEKVVITDRKNDSVKVKPSSYGKPFWVNDSSVSSSPDDLIFADSVINKFKMELPLWREEVIDVSKLSHLQDGIFHRKYIEKLTLNKEKLHSIIHSMSLTLLQSYHRKDNIESLFHTGIQDALHHYLGSEKLQGTLGALSGLTTKLDENAKETIEGWCINPAMIHWVDSVLIPQDPAYKISDTLTAQDVYDTRFKTKLRLLFSFLQKLDAVGLRKEVLAYNAMMFREENDFLNYLQKRYNNNPDLRMSYYQFSDVWVCGFWMRRTLDGTIDEFAEVLYKYLEIYDNEWFSLQESKVATNTLRLIAEQVEQIVGEEPQGDPQFSYAFTAPENAGDSSDIFRTFWKNIDQMSHEDYDEYSEIFPECAIGCLGDKILKVIPYHRICKEFGASPFLTGPHTKDSLDLENSSSFGYYDPDFVRWLTSDGITALEDKKLHLFMRPYYHSMFKYSAHKFYTLYTMAASDKIAFLESETEAYLLDAEDGDLEQERYERYLNFLPESEKKYHRKHLNAHALMWWMRRHKDGTDELFFELLKKFILTYEEALPEVAL